MSSPTMSSSGSSQLFTRSHIAEALAAHARYVERLNRWYEWLGDDEDATNADKLMLFKLIESTMDRRKPGGEWANQDPDLIPTADKLWEMLDETKYVAFRSQVERLRNPVERAGLEFVTMLQSPQLLAELDLLPWHEQLLYAGRFADQLSSSNVGFRFLREAVETDVSPLPVFHPDRLFKKPGNFLDSHNAIMGRAASVYAEVFVKVAPAILVNTDYNAFAFATLELINKYFPEDVLDALTFEDKIDDVRIYLQQNPNYLDRFLAPAAAGVSTVMELVGVYFALDALRKDPSIRNSFGLLRAIASLTTTLAASQAVLRLPKGFALQNRIVGINVIVAVYDLAIAAVDTHASWRTNDLSVAAGHALQGVGLVGAAAISTWAAVSAATTVAPSAAVNPLAGVLLTLGALVVTFGGTFLIMYTQDPPIERWFENNYFGTNWDNIDADESPLEIMFRWKRLDGTADIPRQVSEYLSMFFPMTVTAKRLEGNFVIVDAFPSLGYHESDVFVKRIKDEGLFSDPPRYSLIPLYMKPANRTDDGVTIVRPSNPTEDDRLTNWFRRFTALEMSQEFDPDYDASGSFIEVDLTIPDKFQAALSGIVMASPGVMDKFPFVLRARVRVE